MQLGHTVLTEKLPSAGVDMPSKKSPKLAHAKMQGADTPADYRNKLSASIVENAENVASLNVQYAAIAQISHAEQSDLIPASYPEGSSRMASGEWNAELDNSASLKAYGIPPLRLPPVRSKALANDSGFPNSGLLHCLDTSRSLWTRTLFLLNLLIVSHPRSPKVPSVLYDRCSITDAHYPIGKI